MDGDARAAVLAHVCGVTWPAEATRTTVVGADGVTWDTVDLWRHMGARVRVLRRVS